MQCTMYDVQCTMNDETTAEELNSFKYFLLCKKSIDNKNRFAIFTINYSTIQLFNCLAVQLSYDKNEN